MKFFSHAITGVCVSVCVLFLFPVEEGVLFFLVCVIFSVFPDIDTPKSVLGKKFKIVGWIFRHRGVFHQWWFAVLWAGIIFGISQNIDLFLATFLGYGTHLVLDKIV